MARDQRRFDHDDYSERGGDDRFRHGTAGADPGRQVARNLTGLILQGEFEPGERLIEEQLSERFGVSRPPVREACAS